MLNASHISYLTLTHGLQLTGSVLVIIYLNLKTKSNKVNLGTISFIWVTGHVNETGRKDEARRHQDHGELQSERFYCSLSLI